MKGITEDQSKKLLEGDQVIFISDGIAGLVRAVTFAGVCIDFEDGQTGCWIDHRDMHTCAMADTKQADAMEVANG